MGDELVTIGGRKLFPENLRKCYHLLASCLATLAYALPGGVDIGLHVLCRTSFNEEQVHNRLTGRGLVRDDPGGFHCLEDAYNIGEAAYNPNLHGRGARALVLSLRSLLLCNNLKIVG